MDQFPYLKRILKGISNKDPIPIDCVPFTDDIVLKIAYQFQEFGKIKHSWFFYILRVASIFAWGFSLRCSEYTRTRYWDAPLKTDIGFDKSKNGTDIIKFRLDRRKTNCHGVSETIAIPCTCVDFQLCCYHTIETYLERREKYKIKTNYLFAHPYGNQWKALTANTFRNYLKKALLVLYGKHYNPKKHRAHSFRYGGITSMGNIGIPKEYIRRVSGHAPGSQVLEQYLKMSPKNVASLIKKSMKKWNV